MGVGALVAVLGAPSAAAAFALEVATALTQRAAPLDVVLADLTRTGRLSALDPASTRRRPRLADLADALRWAAGSPTALREQVRSGALRGLHRLPGLQHPSDWTTLGPRTLAAVLEVLRGGTGDAVVALVDADLDGEAETGSLDIEDRHRAARTAVAAADLVVVVADDSAPGRHDLALLAAAVADLRAGEPPGTVPSPVSVVVGTGTATSDEVGRAAIEVATAAVAAHAARARRGSSSALAGPPPRPIVPTGRAGGLGPAEPRGPGPAGPLGSTDRHDGRPLATGG
jgi:hypothetical protein